MNEIEKFMIADNMRPHTRRRLYHYRNIQTMCINANKPPLTSFELNHSSGSGLVDHSVATLLTSDGITLSQRERSTTLGTVVLHTQGLAGDVTVGSMRDGGWSTETFSLRRRHDG